MQFAAKSLLRLGIVLLGLQLSLTQVRELGAPGLVLVVVVVGFLVAVTINSLFDIPRAVTADAKWMEQSLLGAALVGLGADVDRCT